MKLLFIDLNNSEFLKEIKKYNIGDTLVTDVENIKGDNIAYVSPANAFLFMDGGIDMIYSRKMFTEIEPILKKQLEIIGIESKLGRNYFPIGSAIINPVANNCFLISAPTMFLPQNVSQTHNAYWAFYAILKVISKSRNYRSNIDLLVVPALCGGIGGMSGKEVAKQIYQAFRDFINRIDYPEMKNINNFVYFNEPNKDEQPNYYSNTELK